MSTIISTLRVNDSPYNISDLSIEQYIQIIDTDYELDDDSSYTDDTDDTDDTDNIDT